jgi:hypothetical protein
MDDDAKLSPEAAAEVGEVLDAEIRKAMAAPPPTPLQVLGMIF